MPRKPRKGKFKLKTHKATAKRFKVTGSGKVMRTKGGKSHLRRRKSARVKRKFDRMLELSNSSEVKRVKKLAPYLGRYKANPPG
ncbi:MAG: 50S ribosomal protein L35 [Phototrophicales bacterium]|nr:MAG: 50S ribosomal protein L35 [Phototrophicales bacterium]